MKTFIIAAMSADGYIAKDSHHPAFWTSKEDKKRFVELTKRAGVVIMGSNTFRTLHRPLHERLNIVYTHSSEPLEGAEITTAAPEKLLSELSGRGYEEAAVCGGAGVYTMFLKANVIDRIYLTVEPILFGSGVRLFNEELNGYHLKLEKVDKAENGALLLEYKVDYSGTPKKDVIPE